MSLANTMLSEISQLLKDKYCMIPLVLRVFTIEDTESRVFSCWWLGAGKNSELLFNGSKVSVLPDETSSGDVVCITMLRYLMPVDCMLKDG